MSIQYKALPGGSSLTNPLIGTQRDAAEVEFTAAQRLNQRIASAETIQQLPTAPGLYRDSVGRPWCLHLTGVWEGPWGRTRPITHNPALVIFGPFTGPITPATLHTEKSNTA